MQIRKITTNLAIIGTALAFSACSDVSFIQKNSPASPYKDYKGINEAVLGVGKPLSEDGIDPEIRFSLSGSNSLDSSIGAFAQKFGLTVRWDQSIKPYERGRVLITKMDFNESRDYLEEVYKIQIVREGSKKIAVLPQKNQKRIKLFNPGDGITLGDAIKGLAKQCDMNVVVTENRKIMAQTLISTELSNLTCDDAMESLLAPHNLSLHKDGSIYTIGGLPQRQWSLNLLEDEVQTEKSVSFASSLASDSSGGGSTASSGTNNSIGGDIIVKRSGSRKLWSNLEKDLNALITKSCEEKGSYVDTTSNAKSNLTPPPSVNGSGSYSSFNAASNTSPNNLNYTDLQSETNDSKGCGYTQINREAGLIQMRAPADVLDEADAIINRIQEIASRRLLVQARVIAVSKSREYDQGVDWKAGNTKNSIGYNPGSTSITTAISNGIANATEKGIFGISNNKGLDFAVRLAESYGTTYQLIQPTMEVMDRQTSVLIDGRNEKYFIRNASSNTDSTGLTTTQYSIDQESQFVGLQFSVTAQVADNGDPHTLEIQVPITSIDRYVELQQSVQGSDQTITDMIPIATTRLIDQKVRAYDGEIKVIGGLTQKLAVDTESGVPILRDVPVAGKLVNDESITYKDVEYVVIVQAKRIY